MAADASVKDALKNLECSICLENFDNPKELACHHLFCKSCLDEIVQFDRDGEGRVNCSHLCTEDTTISETQITSDLDEFEVNNERLDVLENQCGTTKCFNMICSFCLVCKTFLCKTCKEEHDNHQTNHTKVEIAVGTDNLLKVLCETHKTVCEYIHCNNEVTCVYCVNRMHVNHQYEQQENQIKRIKDKLDAEMQKVHSLPQLFTAAKQSISTSKERFEQAIKYRKIKCLYKYIPLLHSEEQVRYEQFKILSLEHQKEFDISQSVDPLEEILKKTDLELCLLKENIVDRISQIHLSCRTTSLSENNFLSGHPLGEFVIAVEEVVVGDLDDTSSFKFNVTESFEEESLTILLLEFKDFLQEGELFSKWNGVGDISARPPDFVDVAPLSMKEKLRKEVITLLQRECEQELDYRGFEYIEELIISDDQDKLKLLLSGRPDFFTMRGGDWDGTASIVAAQYNKLEILELFLNNGDMDAKDRDGDTVLHHASFYGSKECARWLCEGNFSHLLNVQNKDGKTPLHWAACNGYTENVKILCEHGADVDIRDNYGYTALDIATQSNHQECVHELQTVLEERKHETLGQ